jgi:serine/threonine protein phosphatase PrpC
VQAGDRYVLCSDGLTRTVPDGQIQQMLQKTEIAGAVRGLIEASLQAGAPDNVTVVVVEALGNGSMPSRS